MAGLWAKAASAGGEQTVEGAEGSVAKLVLPCGSMLCFQ